MGHKCNLSCVYCFRSSKNEPEYKDYNEIGEPFREYLINVKPGDLQCVTFSGGEPLLYFEQIKAVSSFLPKEQHKKIITNGTLLTSDIVSYCNNEHIELCLSYDGIASSTTRGVDILKNDKILSLVKSINLLSFSCVITALNNDVWGNYKYIRNVLGDKAFSFIPSPICVRAETMWLVKGFDYDVFERSFLEYMLYRDYEIAKQMPYKHMIRFGTMIDLNGDILSLKNLRPIGNCITSTKQEVFEYLKAEYDFTKCLACSLNEKCSYPRSFQSEHLCEVEERIKRAYGHAKIKMLGVI